MGAGCQGQPQLQGEETLSRALLVREGAADHASCWEKGSCPLKREPTPAVAGERPLCKFTPATSRGTVTFTCQQPAETGRNAEDISVFLEDEVARKSQHPFGLHPPASPGCPGSWEGLPGPQTKSAHGQGSGCPCSLRRAFREEGNESSELYRPASSETQAVGWGKLGSSSDMKDKQQRAKTGQGSL